MLKIIHSLSISTLASFTVFLFCPPSVKAQIFTPEKVIQDLAYLEKAISVCHPKPFRFITKDSFSLFIQALSKNLPTRMSSQEAVIPIKQAVARIGCIHTSVLKASARPSDLTLPLSLRFWGDSLYVFQNFSSDKSIPTNRPLLRIQDMLTTVLWEKIGNQRASDGNNGTFEKRLVNMHIQNNFQALFGQVKTVRVVVQTGNSPTETSTYFLSPIRVDSFDAQNKLPTPAIKPVLQEKNRRLYFPKSKSVAVLDIDGFQGSFDFFQKAMTEIEKRQTQNLVIDLRNNLGGNIKLMSKLLKYFVPEPFSYTFERTKTKKAPYLSGKMKIRHALIWLKRQSFAYPMTRVENRKVYTVHLQPLKEKRYKGQVFVLVNGLTASSASMCASFLKYKAQAKIVGEETGGGEAGNSGLGNIEVTLPQTGFRVQIPNFYLNYHVTQDLGRGIRPDIFFESKLASILRGSDDMLEKVFSEL